MNAKHGDQQHHDAYKENDKNHHTIRQRIHHPNQRARDQRPIARQPLVQIVRLKIIYIRSVIQEKFNQIFLLPLIGQRSIVLFTDQETFRRCHHRVHLRVPDKTSNCKLPFPNFQHIPWRYAILGAIGYRNIYFSWQDYRKFAVHIQQEVKTLPLHTQTVVLRTIYQIVPAKNNLAVVQVQKTAQLPVLHLWAVIRK